MKGAKALLPDHTKQETYTSAEIQEHFKKKEEKRISKYGNVRTEYNGRKYSSKKEADTAKRLDMLVKAGYVEKWKPQVTYVFDVNDVKVGSYILDFKIWFEDGRIEHWDCKGDVRPESVPYKLFKIKQALMKALFAIDVIEK